jgi:hypothetical protein
MKTCMRFRGYFEFNSQNIYRSGKHFEQDVVGGENETNILCSVFFSVSLIVFKTIKQRRIAKVHFRTCAFNNQQ